MYAEAELELPSFSHGFLQEVAVGSYHGHYSHLPLPDDGFISGFHVGAAGGGLSMGNMVQTCAVSEYDMGGEGDLFKAPEPILEVPSLELDPVTAAIISVGGDVITETIKVADIESIQTDHLNDIFYECKKDLLEESEIEDSISELLDVKIPAVQMDEVPLSEKFSYAEGSMQKSVSSGCLSSVEWIPGGTRRPDFLDFQGLDFEAAILGLRRAYSEGDIQNLGKNNTSIGNTTAVCSSFEQLLTISDVKTERQQKLSSMLAGRLLQTVNPEFVEGLRRPNSVRLQNQTYQSKRRTRQDVEVVSSSHFLPRLEGCFWNKWATIDKVNSNMDDGYLCFTQGNY